MCMFVLTACVAQSDTGIISKVAEPKSKSLEEIASETEQDLARTRDVIVTLNFFDNVYGGIKSSTPRKVICLNTISQISDFQKYSTLIMKTSIDLPFDKKCLLSSNCLGDQTIEYKDSSDECILARRNAKENFVGYFNFQKYLPEGTVIKTDGDFANLYALYKATYLHSFFSLWGWEDDNFVTTYAERDCYKNKEQTQAEKNNCEEEEKQFIRNVAFGKAATCSDKYKKKYSKLKKELKNTSYMYATKESGDAEMETKFGAINLCVPDKIYLDYVN